jgi:hypothetical protein
MNLRARSGIFCAIALLLPATPALASGSLVVDNADIVSYDTYQVESWLLMQNGAWTFWQAPAVQPVHNLEITVAAGEGQRLDRTFGQDLVLQGKGLIRPLAKNTWGVGLASGTILNLDGKTRGLGSSAYLNLPFSRSFEDDRYLVHLNAGWAFDPTQDQPHAATWGLGGEFNPCASFGLVGEVFGSTRAAPTVQAGVRLWLVPEHFNVMCTAGLDANGPRLTGGLGYYQ